MVSFFKECFYDFMSILEILCNMYHCVMNSDVLECYMASSLLDIQLDLVMAQPHHGVVLAVSTKGSIIMR